VDEPAAILDYASPRKRGKMRLPAVSRLAVAVDHGRVTVVESLAGQAVATAALCFGTFIVLLVGAGAVNCFYDFDHHKPSRDWFSGLVMVALAGAELAAMVAVLQQTWRRTVLAVEYDDLRLAMLSPLHRRRYRWVGQDIADVLVVPTAATDYGQALAELLITRVVGGEIRLFTDHTADRLAALATAVHDMLRQGTAAALPSAAAIPIEAVAPASPEPAVPADLSPRAEQTAGRLVDMHRNLRERRRGRDG
jgi:hypothetical protein